MVTRRNLQRHLLVLGILVLVVGLVAASDSLHNRTQEIIVWTEGLISRAPLLGMLVFVLLAMLSAMLAFFSSALLAPIAIYAWGEAACFALLWLGWCLGGIVTFCIGRFLGRSAASMIIGDETVDSWQSHVHKRTKFIHVLAFQAVIPSEIPGYLLGILHYPFLLYLLALGITEIPYAIAVVYLGEAFLVGRSAVFLLVGVGLIALAAFLLHIYRRLPAFRKLR